MAVADVDPEFFRRDCDICDYYSTLVIRTNDTLPKGALCACGHPAVDHAVIHPHVLGFPGDHFHEFRHFDEGVVRVELASIIQALE